MSDDSPMQEESEQRHVGIVRSMTLLEGAIGRLGSVVDNVRGINPSPHLEPTITKENEPGLADLLDSLSTRIMASRDLVDKHISDLKSLLF